MRRDIVIAAISFVAGIVVAYLFYYQSGNDLEKEAAELRRLNNLMLRAMENAGQVKLNRDQDGRIVGLVIEVSGAAKGTASASGDLTSK